MSGVHDGASKSGLAASARPATVSVASNVDAASALLRMLRFRIISEPSLPGVKLGTAGQSPRPMPSAALRRNSLLIRYVTPRAGARRLAEVRHAWRTSRLG